MSQRLNLNVQNKQLLVEKHNELKLIVRSLILLSAMQKYSNLFGRLNNTGMGLQLCTVFLSFVKLQKCFIFLMLFMERNLDKYKYQWRS